MVGVCSAPPWGAGRTLDVQLPRQRGGVTCKGVRFTLGSQEMAQGSGGASRISSLHFPSHG